MNTAIAFGFLGLLGFVLLLNIFSLPANWIFVTLALLWGLLHPNPGNMGLGFFAILVGLAILGEIVEYITQAWGAKRYGSSTTGAFAGLVGAFIGAIVGLPFLFGFGALIGAFVGAWVFCYTLEVLRGRTKAEAWQAAKGALIGRFMGIVVKCGIGMIMLGMVYHAMQPILAAEFPAAPPSPISVPEGIMAI